jgi:preprotein translocase subunit Sec63
MIESVLGGAIRLISWLVSSAASLYYLVVVLVVLGGFVMFLGSMIHYLWTKSQERPQPIHYVDNRRVDVHVENLNVTIQMSEDQLHEFLDKRQSRELPASSTD